MKYAYAAIAFAAIASAQSLADVPKCAIPCLDKSIGDNTDCEVTDLACVCENFDKVQGDATSCVIEKCGAETALNEVLPAAQKLCENPPPAGGDDSSSAPAPTSEAPATSAPAEPTDTPEESSSEVGMPEEPTPTPQPLPEPTTAVVPPPAETDGEPTPVPTAGAATLGSMGALGMAVLAALAL